MTVRVLSVHAGYRCRGTGACCTSGWPIPIEADRLAALANAIDDGRLAGRRTNGPLWMRPAGAPADMPALLAADHLGCAFFDPDDGRRCRIHHVLGHDALPLACRQFPRVSVRDPRGVSVTLSHYCPTAAGLIAENRAITIDDDAPGFPTEAEYVGLDVRRGLPPLLRPDMLMDWDAWWRWEARAVAAIARPDRSPHEALAHLASVVETARAWSPDRGPLATWIDHAFERAGTASRPPRRTPDAWLDLVQAAIPDELRPAALDRPGRPSPVVVRAFVAAHAFGSWTAHLGKGLRSWLGGVEAALALVDLGLGVRQADLLLRHLADPHVLARAFSQVERR